MTSRLQSALQRAFNEFFDLTNGGTPVREGEKSIIQLPLIPSIKVIGKDKLRRMCGGNSGRFTGGIGCIDRIEKKDIFDERIGGEEAIGQLVYWKKYLVSFHGYWTENDNPSLGGRPDIDNLYELLYRLGRTCADTQRATQRVIFPSHFTFDFIGYYRDSAQENFDNGLIIDPHPWTDLEIAENSRVGLYCLSLFDEEVED